MFEILNRLPVTAAVSSAHFAIRHLRHRHSYPRRPAGVPTFDLQGLKSEPTPEEKMIALKLLKEIGDQEHVLIGDNPDDYSAAASLDDDQARRYSQVLTEILLDRVKPSTDADRRKAQEILDDLRRSYSTSAR